MSEDVRAWWEATAGDFQDEANVEVGLHWGRPEIDDDRMVGDVEDAEVLELGCGGGQLTVGLAERGATVTGSSVITSRTSMLVRSLPCEEAFSAAWTQQRAARSSSASLPPPTMGSP